MSPQLSLCRPFNLIFQTTLLPPYSLNSFPTLSISIDRSTDQPTTYLKIEKQKKKILLEEVVFLVTENTTLTGKSKKVVEEGEKK